MRGDNHFDLSHLIPETHNNANLSAAERIQRIRAVKIRMLVINVIRLRYWITIAPDTALY